MVLNEYFSDENVEETIATNTVSGMMMEMTDICRQELSAIENKKFDPVFGGLDMILRTYVVSKAMYNTMGIIVPSKTDFITRINFNKLQGWRFMEIPVTDGNGDKATARGYIYDGTIEDGLKMLTEVGKDLYSAFVADRILESFAIDSSEGIYVCDPDEAVSDPRYKLFLYTDLFDKKLEATPEKNIMIYSTGKTMTLLSNMYNEYKDLILTAKLNLEDGTSYTWKNIQDYRIRDKFYIKSTSDILPMVPTVIDTQQQPAKPNLKVIK